jgi:hypothetical protein
MVLMVILNVVIPILSILFLITLFVYLGVLIFGQPLSKSASPTVMGFFCASLYIMIITATPFIIQTMRLL